MANNKIGLGILKSLVDKLFNLFANFIDGYDVKDTSISNKSGQVALSLVLSPDEEKGITAPINVDLVATNVGSAFSDVVKSIKNLNLPENSTEPEKEQRNEALIQDVIDGLVTLGENESRVTDIVNYLYRPGIDETELYRLAIQNINNESIPKYNPNKKNQAKRDPKIEKTEQLYKEQINVLSKLVGISTKDPIEDITIESAVRRNAGILGINIAKACQDNLDNKYFNIWKTKAFDNLKFTLRCETDKADAGEVSDQPLINCIDWIFKYIEFAETGAISDNPTQISQKSKEDKYKMALSLVGPILVNIQNELKNLYQDKLNTELSLDKAIPQPESESTTTNNTSNEQQTNQSTESITEQTNREQEATNVNESKHITMKLQKIQGSEDINLLALSSNYLPGETLDDIDNIINQDEFIAQLTEDPQSFAINVDDEGYDIDKCEECNCDPCASLCEIFKAGIRAYRNLYIIHWMSKGNDMMKLHLLAEDMYKELIEEIDTIGELLVEKQGTVPQLDFECDYVPVQNYDFQSGLTQIQSLIQMYIDCIDYAYCNQDSDVQSTLDEWLRYWKKQLNYFVERQEV